MDDPFTHLASMNLQAVRDTCPKCEQKLRIDLAGLSAMTDVICPACNCSYRYDRAHIRRLQKRVEKAARTIRGGTFSPAIIDKANAAVLAVAAAKAHPLPVARIIAPDWD
jgi:hypothetical protein